MRFTTVAGCAVGVSFVGSSPCAQVEKKPKTVLVITPMIPSVSESKSDTSPILT